MAEFIKMSAIIDFYNGDGPDGSGRLIEETLNKPFHWLESTHDWVQWLFPLREESAFNPEAPLLTDEDVKRFDGIKLYEYYKFCLPRNLQDAVNLFLNFLGIQCTWYSDSFDRMFSKFSLSDSFDLQKYTWFEFNHNHLRISRFLGFLSIIGSSRYAAELLAFMKKTAEQHGVVLNPRSIEYWELALTKR